MYPQAGIATREKAVPTLDRLEPQTLRESINQRIQYHKSGIEKCERILALLDKAPDYEELHNLINCL